MENLSRPVVLGDIVPLLRGHADSEALSTNTELANESTVHRTSKFESEVSPLYLTDTVNPGRRTPEWETSLADSLIAVHGIFFIVKERHTMSTEENLESS